MAAFTLKINPAQEQLALSRARAIARSCDVWREQEELFVKLWIHGSSLPTDLAEVVEIIRTEY